MPYPEGTHMLLLAILAQVALMVVLLFSLGIGRFSAVMARKVRFNPDGSQTFPKKLVWLSDCVNNQFQVPLLYFAAALLAMQLNAASELFAIFAWVFVVFRYLHAAIFVSINHILSRFSVFVVSALAVLAMWVVLALRILGA